MKMMEVHPIGTIAYVEGEFSIVLNPEYAPALRGLDGYSHVQVVWWFDRAEDTDSLIERKPYAKWISPGFVDRWISGGEWLVGVRLLVLARAHVA